MIDPDWYLYYLTSVSKGPRICVDVLQNITITETFGLGTLQQIMQPPTSG